MASQWGRYMALCSHELDHKYQPAHAILEEVTEERAAPQQEVSSIIEVGNARPCIKKVIACFVTSYYHAL